jgi:hypothetical protein
MSVHSDDLDASLAEQGEDIVLRRVIAGVKKEVTVRAKVRTFRLSASDIVTGISKIPFVVVISMTQIRAAGWPVGAPAAAAPPFDVDPAIPVIGDMVIIKGILRTVKSVDPIDVNSEIVRVNMMVEG